MRGGGGDDVMVAALEGMSDFFVGVLSAGRSLVSDFRRSLVLVVWESLISEVAFAAVSLIVFCVGSSIGVDGGGGLRVLVGARVRGGVIFVGVMVLEGGSLSVFFAAVGDFLPFLALVDFFFVSL